MRSAGEALGVKTVVWEDPSDPAPLAATAPDVACVAAFGVLLSPQVLAVPRVDFLNVHPSLLPRHRGGAPVPATILAGDQETGVTIHRTVEALDAGPAVLSRRTEVGDRETAGELLARLGGLGGECLDAALGAIEKGTAAFTEQDQAQATECSRLVKDDGRVRWPASATQVDRQIRAVTPWPGARTSLGGRGLTIHRGRPMDQPAAGPAGSAAECPGGLAVACGSGSYMVEGVQPDGRREMSAADWLRGTPLPDQARFESP